MVDFPIKIKFLDVLINCLQHRSRGREGEEFSKMGVAPLSQVIFFKPKHFTLFVAFLKFGGHFQNFPFVMRLSHRHWAGVAKNADFQAVDT